MVILSSVYVLLLNVFMVLSQNNLLPQNIRDIMPPSYLSQAFYPLIRPLTPLHPGYNNTKTISDEFHPKGYYPDSPWVLQLRYRTTLLIKCIVIG